MRQLNYQMINTILSELCSVECGDIFFACQTTRGMEMSKCRDTNIFIFWEGEKFSLRMNTRKKPITLFQSNNDRTDLIPNTSVFNTACCMQLPSWSIYRKCIRLYDKHLRPSYTLLPLLSTPKNWWDVETSKGLVWVWCNTRRACYLLDLWLVWYQAFYSNNKNILLGVVYLILKRG